jgi:hypothetical protein
VPFPNCSSQVGKIPTQAKTAWVGHPLIFYDQICNFRLLDFQIGLGLEHLAHFEAIGLLVTLGARRPDGRATGSVQQAELDADRVGDFTHDSAQGVNLTYKVAFRDAANRRVAGHLSDQIDVQGEEPRLQAHAGTRYRGLAAGMAGADYDYIELFSESGHLNSQFYFSNGVEQLRRLCVEPIMSGTECLSFPAQN